MDSRVRGNDGSQEFRLPEGSFAKVSALKDLSGFIFQGSELEKAA
ncbi:hypothetical protein L1281_001426 [Neisseria sp. HSC-16F19]|nr:hypothetical protein [Neisseria sp. HSC-16F19]MCP2040836.1 hypothetical protein [Neisseria sp. HSC-16F19]